VRRRSRAKRLAFALVALALVLLIGVWRAERRWAAAHSPPAVLGELARRETWYRESVVEQLVRGSDRGNFAHLDQLGGSEPSYSQPPKTVIPWGMDLRSDTPSRLLAPGRPCIASSAIRGYRYASYLASDARTAGFLDDAGKREADEAALVYARCVASQRRFVIVAWPVGPSGGDGACWYVDQEGEPKAIALSDVRDPDQVVIAAYGSIDRAVGLVPSP
jgi:hypothetical protein